MKEKHNFLEYFTMDKKHLRPALSAFLLMLTMSILSKALSFFVAPVCEDLGFGRGSFTLYYSLMVVPVLLIAGIFAMGAAFRVRK